MVWRRGPHGASLILGRPEGTSGVGRFRGYRTEQAPGVADKPVFSDTR